MDLIYRIQKNSMNITCFFPQKIIFNLVRLLHTLRKQLNSKYKMLFFLKYICRKLLELVQRLFVLSMKNASPSPLESMSASCQVWLLCSFLSFFFMIKIASFLSSHFKTLLYYDCQLIFTSSIISVI